MASNTNVGHNREMLVKMVMGGGGKSAKTVVDRAEAEIERLAACIGNREAEKIGEHLENVYNLLDEAGDLAWRIAEKTELMDHLMRVVYPMMSPELFTGAVVIFSDCLLESADACRAAEKAGFVRSLFDLLESGEFPADATTAVVYSTGLLLSELPDLRWQFRSRHLLEKVMELAKRAPEAPAFEVVFLIEQLFLDPVDSEFVDAAVPFLTRMFEQHQSPEVRDRVLRALIRATSSFHPLARKLIENNWLSNMLSLIMAPDWDLDVKTTALCLLRHLLDYDKGRTDQLISVDVLNAVAHIVEERSDLAERAFVAVSQLMLNSETEIGSRIISSHLVDVAFTILREGNFASRLSAAILLASLLRSSDLTISLDIYTKAFDDIYTQLLECEKENLIIEALDALITFLGNLQKGNQSDTLTEIFHKDWLIDWFETASSDRDLSGLLASFATTFKSLSSHYI